MGRQWVGGIVLALACGVGAPVPVGAQSDPVDPAWTIRELGGGPVALESFRGKVVFLNAWASWCVPCVREIADIERLAARVADTDIEFALVAVEGEAAIRRHLRRYPTSLPVYLEHRRFPSVFGLRGIPMTWILDREGRIAYRQAGAAPWNSDRVEEYLRELAKSER